MPNRPTLNAQHLHRAISAVRTSAAQPLAPGASGTPEQEKYRYVWLEFENQHLEAVATDGNRLAHAGASIDAPGVEAPVAVALPIASLPLIIQYLHTVEYGSVTLALDNPDFVGWISGPLRLMTPRGDQQPPNWRARLNGTPRGVMFNRSLLMAALHSLQGDHVVLAVPQVDGEPLAASTPESSQYVMPMLTDTEGLLNQKAATPEQPAPELRELLDA